MGVKQLSIFLFVILLAVAAIIVWQHQTETPKFYASITGALSTENDLDRFERARTVQEFVFPRDLGPHNKFQTEWWYYTGNLKTETGRHFGYQLTIFRRALSPEADDRQSVWATNQIYFGHFAVTDTAANKFYAFERFSRGSNGLAGAQAKPFKVWLENWQIAESENQTVLSAEDSEIAIRLNLTSEKARVLQGDRGLSQKGAESGNASYYYSQTRLRSEGQIEIASNQFKVSGYSWLDREWSTSALSKQDSGWDWFALQLSDNRELMLFQIRQDKGKSSPYSAGSLVLADGKAIRIRKNDFNIRVTDHWKSPETNTVYPSGWRISLPAYGIDLQVKPYLAQQEHRHSFAYWEGAVRVDGDGISGSGYVELTGYKN